MKSVQVKIGDIKAFALTSKRWNFNNIGVYIEVPTKSEIHTKWAQVAFEKGMRAFFKTHLHGTHFNIFMQNFGLASFDYDLVPGAFLCEIRAKPHKAGQVTGLFLAAMMRMPSGIDLQHPALKPYKLNLDSLKGIAREFEEEFLKKATVAFLSTGKVREDWGEKAKKVFEQKCNLAEHFKRLGKHAVGKIESPADDQLEIRVNLKNVKNIYSPLYFVQLLDKRAGIHGDDIVVRLNKDMAPKILRDASRIAARESMVRMITNDFQRSAKEKDEIIETIALTAVAAHLPMAYAKMICKSKDLPNFKEIHKELNKLFEK